MRGGDAIVMRQRAAAGKEAEGGEKGGRGGRRGRGQDIELSRQCG
jgi:hypothetical protein